MGRELTLNEVREIENIIDAAFSSTPLPSDDLNLARWIICVQSEDLLRMMLTRVAKKWQQIGSRTERGEFVHLLDNFKYSIRHAFDLCARQLPAMKCGPIPVGGEEYTRSALLMEKAGEYADATRVLSSYHATSSRLLIDTATGALESNTGTITQQYGGIEVLLNSDREEFSPVVLLVALFCGPAFEIEEMNSFGFWSERIHQIVGNARLRHGKIHYNLITNLAREIFDGVNVTPFSAPPSTWIYPWSNSLEAQHYFAALQTICIYNLISVHFSALRNNLLGVGKNQICYSSSIKQLNEDISRISRLPLDVVSKITTSLTLGKETLSPDPALQPLIPIGCNKLAVPGIHIISSNWPRNMLSLHARVSTDSFNASSYVFERSMLSSIKKCIPDRYRCETTYYVPSPTKDEEVDLILVDESSHTILLSELRWMIQPGDVREVLNKKSAIRDKVDQSWRKVFGARSVMAELLQRLGLTGEWTVYGLVVIDGFGGTPSHRPKDIPVVPKDIFLCILRRIQNLKRAHAFLCTTLWLPRRGLDYEIHASQTEMCGTPFNRTGFMLGKRSYMKESLDMYIDESNNMSDAQLLLTPWSTET